MDLLKQAQAAADKLDDQTENNGPRAYEPPKAGPCVARFVSYIEIGKHPQRAFQGREKPPAREAIIEFELLGKKHKREVTFDDETKTFYPTLRVRLAIKKGPRASFFKLLSAMDYGRGNKHMALMLGEAFILNVSHREVETADGKRIYANIKDETGNWKVSAPFRVNEEGESEPLAAPQATLSLRLLLWDAPCIEQWNSIQVKGDNQYLQGLCKEALDFYGSALQIVLSELPDTAPVEALVEVPAVEADEDDPLADIPF